jgi:hypothetical protein
MSRSERRIRFLEISRVVRIRYDKVRTFVEPAWATVSEWMQHSRLARLSTVILATGNGNIKLVHTLEVSLEHLFDNALLPSVLSLDVQDGWYSNVVCITSIHWRRRCWGWLKACGVFGASVNHQTGGLVLTEGV